MKKVLLFTSALSISLIHSGLTRSACVSTPTCSELGYTESSCSNGGLKCPFGNTWNCEITNLKDKINELEKEISSQNNSSDAIIGDILYSDKTTSFVYDSQKTPIGIVFDPNKKLAINLEQTYVNYDTNPETKYLFDTELQWEKDKEESFTDIPTLPNCPAYYFHVFSGLAKNGSFFVEHFSAQNHKETVNDKQKVQQIINDLLECEPDGKKNTQAIYEYAKAYNLSFPVIEFVKNFAPQKGCPDGSWCSAGNWFLPSLKQAIQLARVLPAIQLGYTKVGKKLRFDGSAAILASNEYIQKNEDMLYTGPMTIFAAGFLPDYYLPIFINEASDRKNLTDYVHPIIYYGD